MLKIHIAILSLFAAINVFGQNTQTLEIGKKDTLITNSLYRKITLIDSRLDTASFGFVQTGAFNRRANVVTSAPLQTLLAEYLTNITDQTALNGELLLRLKNYELSEVTGAMSEKGYCAFSATLYAYNGQAYQQLSKVDTMLTRSGMDVTKKLLRDASALVNNLIKNSLTSKPVASESYSYVEIKNFDELYKQKLKAFTTEKFVDGVYNTYRSFMNQTPDKAIKVDGELASPGKVKQVEADGKETKLKGQNAYAIVFAGTPFITTKNDYYPLKKVNTDLIFTGKVRVSAGAEQIAATIAFGMIGALAAGNNEVNYEMKLDPESGRFIKIREVPNNKQPAINE